jgi:hypothetical protein
MSGFFDKKQEPPKEYDGKTIVRISIDFSHYKHGGEFVLAVIAGFETGLLKMAEQKKKANARVIKKPFLLIFEFDGDDDNAKEITGNRAYRAAVMGYRAAGIEYDVKVVPREEATK